jgi:hypothetical protein
MVVLVGKFRFDSVVATYTGIMLVRYHLKQLLRLQSQ